MVERANRFKGQAGLRYVYRHASVARGQYVSLKYVSNSRRASGRVAVVVSKKVHKSAVVRNRIRRRIYELYRQWDETATPLDMVFVAYDARLAVVPANELKTTVQRLLGQAARTARPHAIVNTKEREP